MYNFSNNYRRDAFVSFLEDGFLPEDFQVKEEKLRLNFSPRFASSVTRLGTCRSLDLEVFEIEHNSTHDARVGISRDAFQVMQKNSYCNKALVAFIPIGGNQYRFSFLQIDAEQKDYTARIQRNYSNPRRYSYLLGEGVGGYTPNKFLLDKGRVRDEKDLVGRFSVETLTKHFYKELFEWYQWAVNEETGVTFPNNTAIEEDDREQIDTKIIRLITRLMFVWFIKQSELVPNNIFEIESLTKIIKDFDPNSYSSGDYYNAILQNLFFATLNRAIEDESGNQRGFAKNSTKDVKTLYRYSELFCISEEKVISLFSEIPFLNGGLFECLDKTKTIDGVEKAYNYDGFSRNNKTFSDGRYRNRAFVPNVLFFEKEKGLLSILSRYNFTIEENTPHEQQVALDPELLGKVFENLLGAYNPETKETARDQSGSFYTPREIVDYMVDESLIAYLGESESIRSLFEKEDLPEQLQNNKEERDRICDKLRNVKILDPACGSGAFPMGILNKIVEIIQKISGKTDEECIYKEKLQIIENSIYGVDIQSIATQISKLRFFISLICHCKKDASKPNFGIPTLPNLETKFVSANSLIAKVPKPAQGYLFENPDIDATKKELLKTRHEHFSAKSTSSKIRLRKQDKEQREKLEQLLSDNNTYAPEDAKQLAKWDPYDQNLVAEFFDPEWMFGVKDGFDIVIGNPPYIQLENNKGELSKLYKPCGYKFLKNQNKGDMYCLFYERGWELLKPKGHLCYITSNKWMRAGYGEAIRQFFVDHTNPKKLIDFAGVKVFESATVDTNILLFSKESNQNRTICAATNKSNKDDVKNLSDFVQQNGTTCRFNNSDSWIILSPIEQSIKRKIESVGTPLKDWDINIYRGVLTGCNEAFIISTEKRNEILANCKTEDERKRTAELIRPILRGRDIKRDEYEWANLWLIATFPSRKYVIDDYPAVKQYLFSFGKDRLMQSGEIGSRKKTNNKWFETQDSISYWDLFLHPKICWKAVGRNLAFAIVDSGIYLTAPASFISAGEFNKYILSFLCSSIGKYFIYTNSDTTGAGDIMLNIQSLTKFPIPKITNKIGYDFKNLIESTTDSNNKYIDDYIYKLYGLSGEEISFIESFLVS